MRLLKAYFSTSSSRKLGIHTLVLREDDFVQRTHREVFEGKSLKLSEPLNDAN